MKILLDHPQPFQFAHGGVQTQIQNTKVGLEEHGIEVEFLRWWDDAQTGDLIHYFTVAPNGYLDLANNARRPVVMTTLFSETCNRSELKLKLQGKITRFILRNPFFESIKRQLTWRAYNSCACNIVGLKIEQQVLQTVYNVPQDKIAIVPLGLSETFLQAGHGERKSQHLICTGTINKVKQSVELACMAHAAGVPILFVGKPYHPENSYWQKFKQQVDDKVVKYKLHVDKEGELVDLLKNSKGFVLFSKYENWCLAAHEAAACGLPLLLPDKKWARERFGDQANYFTGDLQRDIGVLQRFYACSEKAKAPDVKLWSWKEAVRPLIEVYERVLNSSR